MSGLFEELRRRNVFRVGAAYVVTAWLVAQVSELALDAFEAPPWVLKVLLLVLAIGFPIALVFSWAYELTPEGIKREAEVDRSQSITPTTGRKLDRVIIGVLLLVIAFMGAERFLLATREAPPQATQPSAEAEPPAGPDKTVAVLPFADLSQAGDQEWFADGLAEEILNALARTPDLLVSSRTSSFKYKGTSLDVPEIAKELGVAHVLEGSVRRSGERIRVTAQLIRAADGFHVWSENYDRDAADVIEIQEDLAARIATALETTLDPQALADMAAAGTRSVEAYLEYMRGVSLRGGRQGREDFRAAYDHFERARSLDPEFAKAHLESATFWLLQLSGANLLNAFTDLPSSEMLARFSERIDAAIAAAPTDADRNGYRARKAALELRIREAMRLYRAYLAERPGDDEARQQLLFLERIADRAAAAETLETVRQRAGHSERAAISYAEASYHLLPYPEAADGVLELLARWPDSPFLLYQAHRTLLWAGRTEEAAKLLARLPDVFGDSRLIPPARQGCAEDDRGPAEEALERLPAGAGAELSSRWHILMLLGRDAEAVELLRPLEDGPVPLRLWDFLVYQQFDPRPYPRLMAVLEREGIDRPPPVKIPFACPPPDNTVAVLPFVNMSGDADREYFSDGMTEEIINALVRVPGLDVAARTSVFAFKGRQADVRAIGRELGVGHVLEGSVRSDGENLRITAQLIKVDDGFHLWSETYDRKLENVFALQEDIATAIAGVLTDTLKLNTAAVSARTEDLGAYDAYLQGRALLRSRTDVDRAVQLFSEATKADPGYAPAWAAMAIAADVLDRHEEAERYARQALELDPDNVDALNALGGAYRDTWRWAEAEAAFDRALALDPNSSELLEDYAEFLASVGRTEEQVAVAGRGYGIDPYLAPLAEVYISGLLATGEIDRARQVLASILEVSSLGWLRSAAVRVDLTARDVESAIARVQAMDVAPELREAFARLVRDPSDQEASDSLKQFITDASGGTPADPGGELAGAALLYADQGAFVLDQILAVADESRGGLPEQFFTPQFASVRRAPGFDELLELVGLPAYWDATAWPEACARTDEGGIRCR